MKFRNKIQFAAVASVLGLISSVGHLYARENLVTAHHKNALKTAATGCQPGSLSTAIDIDINNVRGHLMTGGDMWWNIGEQVAAYEIPKNSGKSSQFAASCWIGGYDQQGQLKVAAQTYRQDGNDYWPGALDANGKITSGQCNTWDKIWKIDKATINSFVQLSKSGGDISGGQFDVIRQWPGKGNHKAVGNGLALPLDVAPYLNYNYAPFVDLNGNGKYEPDQGEYPDITGDEYLWWVFNDAGNVKGQSQTAAIGVEVQTSAFAYATQDFLNNATFCNYRVINRGALTIDSTYIAVWDDCDLGWYADDFIGCDTSRGLGIQYNGTNDDGNSGGHPVNSYGPNPPQVGLDFFEGPRRPVARTGLPDTLIQLGMTNFTYYNNDASTIGNPDNGIQIYYYMTGSIRNGQRFSDDFQGAGIPSKGYGTGPVSNFVFWGDPGNSSEWSECSCNNNPGDRRFIFSSGPFQLIPGAVNDITFGCVWAPQPVGGCPNTNFKTIRNIDDQAQALFDDHFKTVEGPEAPRMVVRELDRKLVFYIVNDYGSNNYGENYGRKDGKYADSLQYHQVVVKSKGSTNPSDSLYTFQGYRVFQLADNTVTSADIFDQTTGEINPAKASEVFECDIRDGVTQIVNYVKNITISDSTNVPQIKVVGKDSGIVHSFELSQDQFVGTNPLAPNSDKIFINYHTYYFVAIAFAYNNFANFDPSPANINNTQDQPYLGSAHGAGGINIPVIAAMPNPANGDMGTSLNSDYGSGVIVTRVEGMGNGGNDVEIDATSEAYIVNNNSIDKAVYTTGKGPIDVKVIDPVKVPAYSWVLQILGKDTIIKLSNDPSNNARDTAFGISNTGSWRLIAMQNGIGQDTIYSEVNIGATNEQILEKYGLSVTVNQVTPPGFDETKNGNNGYVASDITFADPSQPWLYGVQDQADSNFANWLRSGNNQTFNTSLDALKNPCKFNDYTKLDTFSSYQNLLSNFSPTKSTWGPYVLASAFNPVYHAGTGTQCGFDIAYTEATQNLSYFKQLPDVDIVFTNNKQDWTRCAVVEEQEDPLLAQGFTGSTISKFYMRKHAGWDGNAIGNTPIYSDVDSDVGMSWFPGYAIDEGTGQRLNIVFGEDSYLTSDNGNDMIWNPSSNIFSPYDNSIIFGGKHIIYVLGTRYDSDKVFAANTKLGSSINSLKAAYSQVQWVGVPTLNPNVALLPLDQNIIPNITRIRLRVTRPYTSYLATADTTNLPAGVVPGYAANPYYTFSTSGLAPHVITGGDTTNRSKLLSRIYAVPNPYYGYSGYESNRFDTKVRIINLPAQVTINIYTLDGSLIRTLTKNDPNTSYIDWDIRNSAGLPIASGMYLMDVKAVGIGETVLKWFGATRPIDVTTY